MSSLELHKIDFRKFMEAIDQCKGDVYIITEEGDKLNLKSQFCRLIGVAKLVEGGMIKSAKVDVYKRQA